MTSIPSHFPQIRWTCEVHGFKPSFSSGQHETSENEQECPFCESLLYLRNVSERRLFATLNEVERFTILQATGGFTPTIQNKTTSNRVPINLAFPGVQQNLGSITLQDELESVASDYLKVIDHLKKKMEATPSSNSSIQGVLDNSIADETFQQNKDGSQELRNTVSQCVTFLKTRALDKIWNAIFKKEGNLESIDVMVENF
jgi:hypothetical protein